MTAKTPCECSPKVLAYLEIKGRKSKATETNYHKAIHDFVQTMHTTPDELLRLPKQKVIDILEEYINEQVKVYAPKTVNVRVHAVKGFLEHYGKKPDHKFVFDGTSRKSSYLSDIVPDPETLDRILGYASPAGKVGVSLMGYAGLRPAILSQLKLRDFPELDLQTLQPRKEPMLVTIPKGYIGNKAKTDYWTFLPKKGIDYLTTYLKTEHAEPLTPDTKVFGQQSKTVQYHLQTAFKRAGHKTRPYVLRSYFRSGVGHLTNQVFAKFLMGHTNIETLYEFQRALSQQAIEDYRTLFAGIVQYLIPSAKSDPRELWKISLMAKLGISGDEADDLMQRREAKGPVQWQKLRLEDFTAKVEEEELAMRTPDPTRITYETTALDKDDVDGALRLLAEGWERVGPMNHHELFRRRK